MRHIHLLFALVFFLSGCGSSGALYLPGGEKGEVRPTSIEADPDTFQPETEEGEEEGE
jgi:predicted small lipoprotein YifL